MKKNNLFLLLLPMILFTGCKKNPVNRLVNPLPDGVVPNSAQSFYLYDEEMKTGGGLVLIPGGEHQSIDLANKSAGRGIHSVLYSWNGGDVTDNNQTPKVQEHLFAGFQFLVAASAAENPTVTPKNLSGGSYTVLKFKAKGSLSQDTILRVEGPNTTNGTADRIDITSSQLTATWNDFQISLSPSQLTSVRTFFTATFQYTQAPRVSFGGNGGIVYFDDIRYEK